MSEAGLFAPLRIRGGAFRNRVGVSPMCQYSSVDGFATDWHFAHLGSRAVGGSSVCSDGPEFRRRPMVKTLPLAEIKATLSERVRDVENGETVVITRHGRAVAAIVPMDQLEHLERQRAAGPAGGLASIAGGWEDSEDLVRVLEASPRVGQRETAETD